MIRSIIFILTVPVKVQATILQSSRNLYDVFPFSSPCPSCPETSSGVSACMPLPLREVFPMCPSSSSSFPFCHLPRCVVITSIVARISGSDSCCFAHSAVPPCFLALQWPMNHPSTPSLCGPGGAAQRGVHITPAWLVCVLHPSAP